LRRCKKILLNIIINVDSYHNYKYYKLVESYGHNMTLGSIEGLRMKG
jgi:hypothetical protein